MSTGDDPGDAIERAVTARLATELGNRGLLLPPDRLARAEALAAADGARLLTPMIHRCYPLSEFDTQVVTLEFDNEHEASRVRSALAFGAATAGLLMGPGQSDGHARAVELLSAIFNLGIGLLDGVCDAEAETGLHLLELIGRGDVADAARCQRPRGWLRVHLAADLEDDPSASFVTDIVETFFATLHATYAGDGGAAVRARVGEQLAAALAAERSSLTFASSGASGGELTGYSYATSVLPFEIVGTLASGGPPTAAARLFGEAMWRIDDLVDLGDDARSGALNAILLDAPGTGPDALEGLRTSDAIARTAAQAADALARGMELADAGGNRYSEVFLQFIARYAGIGSESS